MRRAGALLAIALAIGCSRQAPEIRLTSSNTMVTLRPDGWTSAKYTFTLTMPANEHHVQMRDFSLIDRAGHVHVPVELSTEHPSDRPDTAVVTFELGDSSDPAELRVGGWRKELHISGSHGPSLSVQNANGLRLLVSPENASPTLQLVVPGSGGNIEVLFPEHVTARASGHNDAEQLYRFRPLGGGPRPAWRRVGPSLEYEEDLPRAVHMIASATLEDDGVRFDYAFRNGSDTAYDMIYAVTDPRLTGEFRDVRLERTFVHHGNGFDLLASYTWPVPAQREQRGPGGVTYYTKSRAVDAPFLATMSADRRWVVASFTRQAGNVWTNPELTCQHVDPQQPLPPHGQATMQVKLLAVRDSLDGAYRRAFGAR